MSMKTEVHGIVKIKEGLLMSDDQDGLKKYKASKLRNKKILGVQQEIDSMKEDIKDIKSLLKEILIKL